MTARQDARRGAAIAGLASLLWVACAPHAADPKPANPDSEFLEFLGAGDDGDPELQEYLVAPDGSERADAMPTPKRGSETT